MSEFLLKIFVKDYTDSKNPKIREKAGSFSSIFGIVCNILLFVLKFTMGSLANSISILSDAFNNLSDCLSCVVTFLSNKLANRPADLKHPFGFGRIEYMSSLFIAILIGIVGYDFFTMSIERLFNPSEINYSPIIIVSLVASVVVKLFMSKVNKDLSIRYDSLVMKATSEDSLSDSITTAVTTVGIIVSRFTTLPIDGIVGIVVSLLILKAAISIFMETINTLLGKPAEQETIDAIVECTKKYEQIIGIHDLIVHNYGPGRIIASMHIEVSADENILVAHEISDDLEKDIFFKLNIIMTTHLDPIETNNELLNNYKSIITDIISKIDPEISMHDFRMVNGTGHINLIFDIVVSHKYDDNHDKLKDEIDELLHKDHPNVFTVITFDHQY